jgi:hypothetical protein
MKETIIFEIKQFGLLDSHFEYFELLIKRGKTQTWIAETFKLNRSYLSSRLNIYRASKPEPVEAIITEYVNVKFKEPETVGDWKL